MNLPHVLLPRPHRLSRASFFSLGGASLDIHGDDRSSNAFCGSRRIDWSCSKRFNCNGVSVRTATSVLPLTVLFLMRALPTWMHAFSIGPSSLRIAEVPRSSADSVLFRAIDPGGAATTWAKPSNSR